MSEEFFVENDERMERLRSCYDVLFFKTLDSTEQLVIDVSRQRTTKTCRYCGKDPNETTFKSVSHAIPISLGNRTLIDRLECDVCNNHFSIYLEDGFSKYTLPHRIINTIRGRKNPKHKDEGFEITFSGRGDIRINVLTGGESRFETVSVDGGHQLKCNFPRQPYRPITVYKMFVKMALALMPDVEFRQLGELREWILNKDHARIFSGVPVAQWEFQGFFDPSKLRCGLFKVKGKFADQYFKYILVINFGNLQYNVVIPDLSSERELCKTMLDLPALVDRDSVETCGVPSYSHIHFDSDEVVRGESIDIYMLFETKEKFKPA